MSRPSVPPCRVLCCAVQLAVLAQLSRNDPAFLRNCILPGIVRLFADKRQLLETLGSHVFRSLSQKLDPQTLYMHLADILKDVPNVEFATLTIEILNLLLLTSPDLVLDFD